MGRGRRGGSVRFLPPSCLLPSEMTFRGLGILIHPPSLLSFDQAWDRVETSLISSICSTARPALQHRTHARRTRISSFKDQAISSSNSTPRKWVASSLSSSRKTLGRREVGWIDDRQLLSRAPWKVQKESKENPKSFWGEATMR
jgi:hypothetical protein